MSRPLVVSALVIIAAIFVVLLASAIQSHQHVRLLKRELDQGKQQLAQSKQALDTATKSRTEMEGNLKVANSTIDQLHKDVDAAQGQLKEKEAQAQEIAAELEKTKKDTFAQLAAEKEANQKQFETITSEATTKLSESEKRVSDLTEQLKSISAQVEQLKSENDAAQSKLTENQSKLEATDDELANAKEAMEQANARVTELQSAGANTAREAEAERSKLQAALDEATKEIERLKLEQQQTVPPVSVSPPDETLPPPEQ
jgi:chromosome segregation ATPase